MMHDTPENSEIIVRDERLRFGKGYKIKYMYIKFVRFQVNLGN